MDKNFQIEVGSHVVLVVAPDDDRLRILKTAIEQTNGDVQIVGTGLPGSIGLIASRVGHSILVVDIEAKRENGGVERLKREIGVVVAPRDVDELSLYLVPPGAEQIEAVLAPEARYEALAEEVARLSAALENETKRADRLAEEVEEFRIKERTGNADVGQTSESAAVAETAVVEQKVVKKPANTPKQNNKES